MESDSQAEKDADLVARASRVSRAKHVRIDEDVEGALAREVLRLWRRLDPDTRGES